MANYKQGEIRDDANNIILAGVWGKGTPYKDIVNIVSENFTALLKDGIANAGTLDGKTLENVYSYTDTAIATTYTKTQSDAKYAPSGCGLGTSATLIANANLATTGGLYRITSGTNCPTNDYYMIYVNGGYSTNDVSQTAISLSGGVMYIRKEQNAVWSAWKQVITKDVSDTLYAPSGYGLGTSETLLNGLLNNPNLPMFGWVDGANGTINNIASHIIPLNRGNTYLGTLSMEYHTGNLSTRVSSNGGGTWTAWKQMATTDNPVFSGSGITLKAVNDAGSNLLNFSKVDNTVLWSIGGGIVAQQDELAFRHGSTNVLYLASNNFVGVGKIPTCALDVVGNISNTTNGVAIGTKFNNTLSTMSNAFKGLRIGYNPINNNAVIAPVEAQSLGLDLAIYNSTSATMEPKLTVTATGVGIGTTSPTCALDVVGAIKCTDVAGSSFAPSGYGLGTLAKDVSNTDLNALATNQASGFFRGNGLTNAPNIGWWYITNISHASTWCTQIATSLGNEVTVGIGLIFTRTCANGTWSPWKQLATTDNPVFTNNVGIGGTITAVGGAIPTLSLRGTLATNTGGIRFRSSTDVIDAYVYGDAGVFNIGTGSANPMAFIANSTERMRLTSTGNLGIGTTAPIKKLEVNVPHVVNMDDEIRIGSYTGGNFYGLGLNYKIDSSGNPSNQLATYTGGVKYTPISFPLGTTNTTFNGNVGIGTTSPKATLHGTGTTILGADVTVPWSAISGLQVSFAVVNALLYISWKEANGVQHQAQLTGAII